MTRGPELFLRPGRTLRMALHPDDLLRPGLRESALKGIDAVLDAGVVALTYGELLDRKPSHVGGNDRRNDRNDRSKPHQDPASLRQLSSTKPGR
jgi:hypothetical protein